MSQLSESYKNGWGVVQNVDLAMKWRHQAEREYARRILEFEKRAKLGDAEAMYWLGVYSEGGLGTQKDALRALEWFERAAAGGHASAAYRTAVVFELSLPDEPDLDRAKE